MRKRLVVMFAFSMMLPTAADAQMQVPQSARLDPGTGGPSPGSHQPLAQIYTHQKIGFVVIADKIKETSKKAIQELQKSGIAVIMLTGDNNNTAKAVAEELNLTDYKAQMLPENKQEEVKHLQSKGKIVAMAGDGINDAPALAQAQVGIAMGTGTDVALYSAGITLVKGDLNGIVRARRLSRITMRNIRQNLFFSFFYNTLGIPLAAGVLYPVLGILLNPMIAAVAMICSSISVIANALRLRNISL